MMIVLPIPPSVNAAYANVAKVGRVKTKKYKNWLRNADSYFLTQKRSLKRFSGPCVVTVHLPANMRGDCSNRTKLPEDFLVSRGITGDDSNNVTVTATKSPDVPAGFCHVEVRQA